MKKTLSLNRGKELLNYDEEDISQVGGYDLVHYDDLAYVASAHQERMNKKLSSSSHLQLNNLFFFFKC